MRVASAMVEGVVWVRGQITNRRLYSQHLNFATIDLAAEVLQSNSLPPLSCPPDMPELLAVCFNERVFGSQEPPPPTDIDGPYGQICVLPFPSQRKHIHLGDVVECAVVWDPPPEAVSESPRSSWAVVAWWRRGARYQGNCTEFAHRRGGPAEAYDGSQSASPAAPLFKKSAAFKRMTHFFKELDTELATIPPDQRYTHTAQRIVSRARQRTHVCERCWLLHKQCMCHVFRELKLHDTLHIVMHPKEFKRTSNTGKILLASSPSSRLLFCGLPEDDITVAQLATQPNTVVLFPSEDSVPLTKYLAELGGQRETVGEAVEQLAELSLEQGKEAGSEEAVTQGSEREAGVRPRLTVLVLDGTWNQARMMNRRLPDSMVRVSLSPDTVSLFTIRQQTQPDRICTIEAVAMTLQELGESESTVNYLTSTLQSHVTHCRQQSSVQGDHWWT